MRKFSDFSRINESLSTMVYKKAPSFDDHQVMSREITVFDMSKPLQLDPPPANDSEETRAEILELKDHMELASPEDKHKMVEYDRAFSDDMIRYCLRAGYDVDYKMLNKINHECAAIVHQLKFKYNRPRPIQIANKLKITFNAYPSVTGVTPSYPSGHSAQSRLMALYIAENEPGHRDEILNIAEEVGLSRLKMGVHFPSDHEAGVSIGDQLFERLKDNS